MPKYFEMTQSFLRRMRLSRFEIVATILLTLVAAAYLIGAVLGMTQTAMKDTSGATVGAGEPNLEVSRVGEISGESTGSSAKVSESNLKTKVQLDRSKVMARTKPRTEFPK